MQSPISVYKDVSVCESGLGMAIQWNSADLNNTQLKDTGYAFQMDANFAQLKATDTNGRIWEYKPYQMHVHAPGEHLIEGVRPVVEFHFVFSIVADPLPERTLAVLAVPFIIDESKAPSDFITALKADRIGSNLTLNFQALLGNAVVAPYSFYNYLGSLTTPNCTESVNWYVLAKPLTMTGVQSDAYRNAWSRNVSFAGGLGNNRIVQSLNDRIVKRVGTALECEVGQFKEMAQSGMILSLSLVVLLIFALFYR
jgi:carbonic anhydrase